MLQVSVQDPATAALPTNKKQHFSAKGLSQKVRKTKLLVWTKNLLQNYFREKKSFFFAFFCFVFGANNI